MLGALRGNDDGGRLQGQSLVGRGLRFAGRRICRPRLVPEKLREAYDDQRAD
jgi:hypothetical protein